MNVYEEMIMNKLDDCVNSFFSLPELTEDDKEDFKMAILDAQRILALIAVRKLI